MTSEIWKTPFRFIQFITKFVAQEHEQMGWDCAPPRKSERRF
jgi:hypothetical protein